MQQKKTTIKSKKKSTKRKKKELYTLADNNYILSDKGICKGKEYFRNEKIILFHGDALDENLFNIPFIDLIVTSPPYNVGIDYQSNDDELSYEDYLKFTKKWIRNCYKWSKKQARFLLNVPLDKNKGGQRSVGADITKIAQDIGWNIIQLLFGMKVIYPEELRGVLGCQQVHHT